MEKFEWETSDSAPKLYVMSIVSGSLFYTGGSQYVPDKSDLRIGWGRGASSHGGGINPPPRALDISFFSYTENQFYQGRFDLPYEKMLSLFQTGYYSPNQEGHITYHQIVVGVAPGGAVAVWLAGIERTTEVFFGQAKKVDLPWSAMTSNTKMPREEYVRRGIEDSFKTPEAIAALKKNGPPIGLWARYRTPYSWQPLFTGMTTRYSRIDEIKYFNGEQEVLDYPLKAVSSRPVPSFMRFIWARTKVIGLKFKLTFDESEIFDAFQKLGANNQPLQLELRMVVVNGKEGFTIWVRNEKDFTQLKHTKIETYDVDDLKE